ncbi:MAG: acetyl-CoA C-acyltransferase [Flexibacter sp. CG_4_10_14_3_um_filter_32_15]|nr:MAG: acetyl-CoA C-acyltransferase [Flexibacter sp. CG_4_10_14_3_um_filter_32_15]
MTIKEVYLVSIVRTPIGSFNGSLAAIAATQLGATAIKGALQKINLDPKEVQEVYMGNVISANLGQAPARQAAVLAGLPYSVPCATVNKVCASGMKAMMFAAQSIMLGHSDVVVAGGMESMSNIPFYLDKARFGGYGYGHGTFIDGLMRDGLADAYDNSAMGVSADKTAEKYGFTREMQDAFAIESYTRSKNATESGKFKDEIVAVEIPQRKGDPVIVNEDEEYKKVNFDKIPALRAVFTPNGTVTAGNASTINDGASAAILMSGEKVKELGLTPIARIVGFADAAQEPQWFTTTPTIAAPKALKQAGLTKNDIDFFEVNEAFSVVTMAFNKELDIDPAIVNVNGGAVSLGHPLGCSGARIVTTLSNVLSQNNSKYGLAAICNGGGGASAIIIENLKNN